MANRANVSRRAQRATRKRRHRARTAGAVTAVVAAIAVVVVAVVVLGGGDGNSNDGRATVEVDMFEFGFDGNLVAPAGEIRLAATNVGQIGHNIGVRGVRISNEIPPGSGLELDLGQLSPGTYELYCDIVGHVDAGMTAALVIAEPDPTPES